MLYRQSSILLHLLRGGFALSHLFALVFGSGIHLHQSLFHEHAVEEGHLHSFIVHGHGGQTEGVNVPTLEPQDQAGHQHSVASVQLSALVSPNKTPGHYLPYRSFPDHGILNGTQEHNSPIHSLSILPDHAPPSALGNVPSVRLGRSPPLA